MSNLSIAQLFKQLNTTEQGLTEYEAQQRLLLEKNELPAGEKSSLLDLIKEQFKDTLVIIV